MSGPRCSWTCAAFSMVEERREKWEKHLPPHVPDKSRERQREGYGEKRSDVFYDMGACCSTAFKMLLTGSRWEEETQLELCGQDPLRDKLTNTHTNAHTESMLCEDLVQFIPAVYYNLGLTFGVLIIISICIISTVVMGHPSDLKVTLTDHELLCQVGVWPWIFRLSG